MKVGVSLNRAPFVGTVEARACGCAMPVKELFTSRTADKAIANMTGYWSIYLTFFGDQTNWLRFTITDVRDGTVIWRDGRAMKREEESGGQDAGQGASTAGGSVGLGRWIVSGRSADGSGVGDPRRDGW